MQNMQELLSRALPFWSKLKESQKDLLVACSRMVKYPRGATVHRCGDDCLGIIYVKKGILRILLSSEEGRELTIFRLKEGELYMLSAACVIRHIDFDVHFESETPSELLVISCLGFDELFRNNTDVKCFALESANRVFGQIISMLPQSLFMGFDKRLALYLLDELGEGNDTRIATTHERIAKNIGSAREVVTRTLKKFSDEGAVELQRGAIIVVDREKLKKHFAL